MRQFERAVMLRAIDMWWVRHLTALDELRTGIGLREPLGNAGLQGGFPGRAIRKLAAQDEQTVALQLSGFGAIQSALRPDAARNTAKNHGTEFAFRGSPH
jgi:hypothetical protein